MAVAGEVDQHRVLAELLDGFKTNHEILPPVVHVEDNDGAGNKRRLVDELHTSVERCL